MLRGPRCCPGCSVSPSPRLSDTPVRWPHGPFRRRRWSRNRHGAFRSHRCTFPPTADTASGSATARQCVLFAALGRGPPRGLPGGVSGGFDVHFPEVRVWSVTEAAGLRDETLAREASGSSRERPSRLGVLGRGRPVVSSSDPPPTSSPARHLTVPVLQVRGSEKSGDLLEVTRPLWVEPGALLSAPGSAAAAAWGWAPPSKPASERTEGGPGPAPTDWPPVPGFAVVASLLVWAHSGPRPSLQLVHEVAPLAPC